MERKHFLKNGLAALGLAAIAPLACSKDGGTSASGSTSSTDSTSTSGGGTSTGSCTVTPTETEGPFPTKTPSSLVKSDITGDRTGVGFSMKIYIKNKNNSCNALSGALVDVWHCDKDGNYSEYGGTSMQSTNYTSVHFLRGRQTTDADGLVTFTSIFPGWYQSRATHIHVHIYNAAGTSLLVTQIAFPEGTGSAVATVNGTAGQAYGYTKGMTGYTYNASDNVFSDDSTGAEVASVTGSVTAGYVLSHTIYVSA
ncbi:Protocatechuate 3,4-dioxygenase beta subunit [Filimonas lacunae]|uniref:Protocatechuate 3,4-dioxygenase beta subunit n=1 Tax=Filimonas lacunae TaxID=477680 RepID=A0A173M9M2_9BACT|nr:intradiol ring-cleavage dioxygenase [Filimonas lacunae]BAV04235.1 protocatechuate dioxygenase [Filimonas lacunae]SIT13789.1 Protocatechuate 3,4-dioxygenase beta subunit [Filimonas lacunae]